MKKKTVKSLFILGFAGVIVGLILASLGFAAGGLDDLKKMSAPIAVHETFDGINSLDIYVEGRHTQILDSDDDKVHVKYSYFPRTQERLKVKQEGKHLSVNHLFEQGQLFQIAILEFLGETLNRAQSGDAGYLVEIYLPKQLTLEKLSLDSGGHIELKDRTIKNLGTNAYVNGTNVVIDGGYFPGGNFEKSQLKNITNKSGYMDLTLKDSSIEGATIYYNNWLKLENVTIKNSEFTSTGASFVGNKVTLENSIVAIEQASIELSDLTVKGEVKLTTQYPFIDVNLSEASRNSINLDIRTEKPIEASLQVADSLKDVTKTDLTAKRDKADNKDKLIIETSNADVTLR